MHKVVFLDPALTLILYSWKCSSGDKKLTWYLPLCASEGSFIGIKIDKMIDNLKKNGVIKNM